MLLETHPQELGSGNINRQVGLGEFILKLDQATFRLIIKVSNPTSACQQQVHCRMPEQWCPRVSAFLDSRYYFLSASETCHSLKNGYSKSTYAWEFERSMAFPNFTFKTSKNRQALAPDLKVPLPFVMNTFPSSFTMKKDYIDLLTV